MLENRYIFFDYLRRLRKIIMLAIICYNRAFFIIYLVKPSIGLAFDTSDPSVSLLQNRISNNFSKKYCNAIQNGFSKDEAMKSAIVKTENIMWLKENSSYYLTDFGISTMHFDN